MTRFCVKHGASEGQQSKRSSLRPTPSSLSDVTPAASNRIAMDFLGKVTYNKLCQLFPVRKHPFPGTFKQICGCLLPSAASIPLIQHKKQVLQMVRRDSESASVDSGDFLRMFPLDARICIRRLRRFSTDDSTGFRICICRLRRFPTDV